MDAVNIRAKFEVRSFSHSWANRGTQKNLGSPWIRPRSLFSQIFKGLLFGWTLWIYVPYLKFVVLYIPGIIGGTKKIGPSLDAPTLPFLQNFSWACVRMDPVNVSAKFAVHSFSRSWDNSDCSSFAVLGWGCDLSLPNLGEGKAVGGRGWHRSKERWRLPIGSL